MVDAFVVDTNVLIVSSAADEASSFQPAATPVEEAALRSEVLAWLQGFEQDSARHAVLDWDWMICGEYQHKLTEQDYGWLAIMAKKDRDEVIWVGLESDADGHAILPDALAVAVTDLADRKMVAAMLAANDQKHSCSLVNACDTDWLECAEGLAAHGLEVKHLIEHWLRNKWHSMQAGQ
ncbi:hypothetical protein CR512_23825 [Pseudomonas putida]|nr:hypothetical protein CR512_23825 [Pseudomonas putida]